MTDLPAHAARLSALESPAAAGDEEIVEVMALAFARINSPSVGHSWRAVLAELRRRGSVIR